MRDGFRIQHRPIGLHLDVAVIHAASQRATAVGNRVTPTAKSGVRLK